MRFLTNYVGFGILMLDFFTLIIMLLAVFMCGFLLGRDQ
jgi:hypothetical protein